MSNLLDLEDMFGQLRAAAGICAADAGELFLGLCFGRLAEGEITVRNSCYL